jgi:3',5'-cyclic AMP phosphodiesterase CpdA
MVFRLAHLSDIHIGPLPDVELYQLVSKRAIGYVNWHRNRRHLLHDNVLATIVADMKAAAPEHVAVTGDLVNLALDAEVEAAKLWLEALGSPADVSVVPGNHDAYVPGAFGKVCHAWGRWMTSDGQNVPVSRHTFPYLRVRGNVAFIGCTSARATAPFMANGFFREDQGERLGKILQETAKQGLFRVVMIHHPPVRHAVAEHKRLYGIRRFNSLIRWHGAELVLHGHSHLPSLHWLEGPEGCNVPVVGVAAAGQAAGSRKPAAQYNLIEIDGKTERWTIRLTRRGLTGPALPPSDISSLDLIPPGAGPDYRLMPRAASLSQ